MKKNLPSIRFLLLLFFVFSAFAHFANAQTTALSILTHWDLGSVAVNSAIEPIQLQAQGGKPPYIWSLKAGPKTQVGLIPVGLSLSASGILSGTPTVKQGADLFTVQVTDANNATVEKELTIIVNTDVPKIFPPENFAVITDLAFSKQFQVVQGKKPYNWTSTSALPAGLVLSNSTGELSGSVSQATLGALNFKDYPISLRLTTGSNATATANFTLTVAKPLEWITESALPAGYAGANYTANLTIKGGKPNYTFSNSTSLPPGLSLAGTPSANGTIRLTGNPTALGNFTFTLNATDSALKTVITRNFTIEIRPYSINGTDTISGDQYSTITPLTFTPSGGVAPYTWTANGSTGFTLNATRGLSINATSGIASGNLTTGINGTVVESRPGNYTMVVNLRDGGNNTISKNVTVQIRPLTVTWVTEPKFPDAKVGFAYSHYLSVNGGWGNKTFALKSPTTLPAGLSLNATTGIISGTPTAATDNKTFTIVASDSAAPDKNTAEREFTLSVAPYGMSINGPDTITGEQYTRIADAPFTPNGGEANYTWSATWAGNATTALTINSATGIVSGNLTTGIGSANATVGNYTMIVSLRDGRNQTITKNVTVQIQPRAVSWVTEPVLLKGKVSFAYSTNVTASGGWGNITYALKTPNTLPAGLSLNSTTGAISGTPTGNGTTNFTIIASDSALPAKNTAERAFSITIDPMDPLVWTVDPAPVSGKVAFAYSTILPTASGGSGNYSYSVNATTLPPGLSFNATTRTISGTPTEAKTFNVSLTVRDNFGNATASATLANSNVQTIPIFIEPYGMSISGPDSISGGQYSSITPATFAPVGGEANYTWNATWSGNATALTINSATGIVSGNLTTGTGSANSAPGNYTMVIRLTDGRNQTITKNVTVQIQQLVVSWITPEELPDGKELDNYSQTLQVEGARAPYTFSLKTGSTLPIGLNLNNSTGVLSGKPTADGNYTFTIIAKDSSNPAANQAERTFTLKVAPYGMAITGPATASGKQYTTLTPADFEVTGGKSPYTWSVSPALPAALSINASTGVISGNLTAVPGNYTVAIKVSDANTRNATANFTVTITQRDPLVWVTPEELPDGKELDAYSQNLTVSGGYASYKFALQSGTLPRGITLNATTGRLAGTANATSEGNYTFTVNASDSGTPVVSQPRTFTLRIAPYGMSVTGPDSGSGLQHSALTPADFDVTGGTAPHTWSATGLPTLLSINAATGIVSGNLTAAPGNYTANITVTDNKSQTASKNFAITILPSQLEWQTPPTLPNGKVSFAYTQNLSVTEGKPPYTFALANGSTLPLGLSLNNSTGVISGRPTTAGTSNFTITAGDSGTPKNTADRTFTLTIDPMDALVWTINPAPASGKVAFAYSANLSAASGGSGNYSYSANASTLPPGLSFNATTRTITGTANASGNFNVSLTVRDNFGNATASATLANSTIQTIPITIEAYGLSINGTDSIVGDRYTSITPATFAPVGGNATYTWSANTTTGLSINATTGIVSGNLTAEPGNYTLVVGLRDGRNQTVSKNVTVQIRENDLSWVTQPPLPAGKVASPYTTNLTVSGGKPAYTYVLKNGSVLPAGLTLNNSTGVISGTPTSASVGGNSSSSVIVTTLAGSGNATFADGIGLAASFNRPAGVAIDVLGNLYVTDILNHKIRKISPNGIVTTFAGSGNAASVDGVGIQASFNEPNGIAIDGLGNFYVADYQGFKIRKISPNGEVSTLAGSGSVGFADGTGAAASFTNPNSIAVDSIGNVYVADKHKIRKITPNGIVTTIAGSESAGSIDGISSIASFRDISGVAVDAGGNVYVGDMSNNKIRKISPAGIVTTFAGSGIGGSGDGVGTQASFFRPYGLAVDGSGNIFVADQGNSKIRKITPQGVVTTVAGSGITGSLDGLGTNATFNSANLGTVDKYGSLYVAEYWGHKIRKISPTNTFSVIARDSGNPQNTSEREFMLPIAPYGMTVNGTTTISGLQYSTITPTTFNAIGGTANYTWSANSTSGPIGLTINATSGVVSGNLTAAPGNYTMLVSVRDGANQTATANVSVSILKLPLAWVTEPALPDGQVAFAYSSNLTVGGGRPTYSYVLANGSTLPPGLSLTATGTLAGSPTGSGNFTFTVNASDSAVPVNTANRTFTWRVLPYPMTITGPDSITGQKFVPITPAQYIAANGTAPYRWSMNSSVTGLSINATTGVVSGTPTVVAGNYTANITVTDSRTPVNQSLTKTVPVFIQPVPALVWSTTSPLPPGQVAYAYTTNLTVGGGRPGYTYALTNGTLPLGLALNNSTGVISGTPTQVGTANFTITASDSDAPTKNTASRPFALTIAPYGMTINGSDVISGQRYSAITPTPYIALNGTANYTWSANNTLGLTINRTTGVVSGNLNASPGNYTLPVLVLDGRNQTATKNVTVSIAPAPVLAWVTPEKLQGGRVALDYALTVAATGGKAPYTYVLKSGNLTGNLTLNSTTGLISGKPATAGTSNFTLTARDSANGTVDRTFNLVIDPYGMGIVGTSPLQGKLHQYFEYQFGVEGGTPSYTWNATTAPAGLSMNATSGVLSGTPTASSNYTTVIRVTDSKGQWITRTFNINISASDALSIVSGPNFGPVSINSTYTTKLQALGGKPLYTWSINGTKPASVNLASDGTLTMNSSNATTANFTVRVQDSAVPAANATKTMSVVFFNPATLVVATDSLYTGWVGEEYSVQLGALGGTQPYDWAITSGTLPAGMNMSETGCIYGTPTVSANTTLTFRVTDAKGLTANKTLVLTIQGKPSQVPASGKLFTDVTNAASLSLPEHFIIAVEDFDNDGREDLLATNASGNVVLMRAVGAFDFRDITANAGLNGVTPVLVADFNNDGVSDILSVNLQRTEATLFLNNGQGVFTRQVLTGLLTGDLANYRDISYADVDGDGDLDLLFNINATTGGGVVAVFNQSNVSQTASPLFSGKSYLVKTTWTNAKFSVTDANGDGKPDLVIVQTNGAWPTDTHRPQRASLYLNTGNTTADYANATGAKTLAGFTEKLNSGITSSSEMSAFTSLDIDNDGDLDLLNGSSDWPWAGSIPRIYINDGTGTYTQQDSPIVHGRFYHHGATVFDADLDGDQDAVWSSLHVFSDVYPRMWENGATYLKAAGNGTVDPAKAFFDSTTAWGIDAKISGFGNMGSSGYAADLDGDGDLDYIANLWSSNRTYKVYRNDSNLRQANWLKVELVGAVSPAQGTGARVEVELNNATAARPAQAAAGSRYEVVRGNFTWPQAKADAEKRGGHLATIGSEAEWNEVKALATDGTTWLGATDELLEGTWRWVDGTPWTYNAWSPGQPDNSAYGDKRRPQHYLAMVPWGQIVWDDREFNEGGIAYICEYERPASTTANSKVAQYLGPETGAVTESSLTFGLADKSQAARVTVYWPSGLRSILENVAGNRTIQIREADELPLPRPTDEGDVIAWGANPNGETTVPTTLGKAVQIAAGDSSSATLLANGTVSVWGTNWAAQRNVPATLGNVVQIAAGNNHYLALTSNGSVVAWGWNTTNQTAVPTTLRRAKFIAAGFNTSYAVTGGGQVVAWGGNDVGQANVPAGLVGVTSLAAGRGHALALKSDGTVIAWGRNDLGQATVPAGLTNVIQIAAGDYHSVALRSNGTVVAWGANWSAQSTAPVGLTNVVQISAKGDRSLALKADNSIVNWGINPDNINPPPSPGQILSTAAGSKHALGLVRKIQIAISGDLPTGTEGQVIPETTFSATGGSGAYTWSVVGTLPPGMTLNATTGKLSGTPTTSGNYTFTVRATSGGRFSDRVVTIEVQKAIRNALWVATTGNDTTGNGTVSKPYATITKAHSMANKGDLIKVLPGNYTESVVIEKAVEISSTAGPAQTIIRSANKASAVFCRGEGVKGGKLIGFTLTGGGGANNPGYNRYGGGFAINAPAGTTFEVKNCIIRNNTDAGITFGGGLHVTGGSTLKLTNSLVHSNAAWANGGAALVEGANLIADRCTIVSNTNNGFNRIGGISGAGNCNIQIKNSILWNNTTNQYGSFSSGPGGNATFTFSYSIVQGGTTATVGGNTRTLVNTGAGCLASDPVFAETTNYTLGTGSPAINTGDPSAAKDADGSRADIGWDAAAANAGSDTDGDGVSDYREIQDGTNPTDPSSFNQVSKGLVAYYPFNGNANDESGNGSNLSISNAEIASDRFLSTNSSLKFINSNAYAFSSKNLAIAGNSDRSISGWFLTNSGGGGVGVGWGDASHSGAATQILADANNLSFWGHYADISTPITSTPEFRWHHYVCVYNGTLSSAKFYRDGELVLTRTLGVLNSRSDLDTISTIVKIGGYGWNPAYSQAGGSIDDIRIYNRALTTAEVTQLYSAESGEPNTVLVQGGTLPAGSALANQTVSAFHIARFETTWAEWKEVRAWAAANGYDIGESGNALADSHPVHSMTWQQILKWLNAKSEMEGLVPVYRTGGAVYKTGFIIPTMLDGANGYRLPIEAEWEWASRGGVLSQGFTYSGSNNLEEVAWYQANNTPQGTKAVGLKKANELGLYDMSGNCWEYCWDLVTEGKRRIRGGGCWDTPGLMAYRWDADTSQPWVNFGFRYVRNAIGEMVTVQGGTLPSGSTLAGQIVQTFDIARFEVTWEEWQTVRTYAIANGYDLSGVGSGATSTHPVNSVNWYDVVKWCNAKSQKEGLTPVYTLNGTTYKTGQVSPTKSTSGNGYRLPSEKEWELAARGGVLSLSYTYSGSNDVNEVAWYQSNSSGVTKEVGCKAANELGIYDMSGNVTEWCEDVADPSYRRVRGGSRGSLPVNCTVSVRNNGNPDSRGVLFGFRLARNLD
jgi:formylglycine-generating enzyme required for sulfatase activity